MKETKQRKWTNEIIFKGLKNNGFHLVDVQFGNGYFIFDHGEDTVVHFHIKECKGWKFGIWWDTDRRKSDFTFFAQYERDIDKFKPSASVFVCEDSCAGDWAISNVAEMCKFIKKHPYRAWKADQTYSDKIWELDDLKWAFPEYVVRYWNDSIVRPIIYKRMNKKYLKLVNEICEKTLRDYKIIDNNEDGWSCSPRYSVVSKKGFIGEDTERGNYSICKDDLSDKKLIRKWEKYQKKADKYYLYDISLFDFYVFVKGGKEQNA